MALKRFHHSSFQKQAMWTAHAFCVARNQRVFLLHHFLLFVLLLQCKTGPRGLIYPGVNNMYHCANSACIHLFNESQLLNWGFCVICELRVYEVHWRHRDRVGETRQRGRDKFPVYANSGKCTSAYDIIQYWEAAIWLIYPWLYILLTAGTHLEIM